MTNVMPKGCLSSLDHLLIRTIIKTVERTDLLEDRINRIHHQPGKQYNGHPCVSLIGQRVRFFMNELGSLPFPQDWNESRETTPGGKKEVRWIEVAQTPGLAPAQILAGRLQAEGIPAYAWQEGAGQAAGLVVGLLGSGHVMVPEEFEERALEILADTEEEDELE